jgi:uncharacterized protein (DUF1501 family)
VHLNFDTHVNHNEVHARNLDIIDQAVDAFLSDIEQRGLADSVLVATVSEFGRRPKENGELGVDHGHASVAFLMGKPVTAGRYGEYSSLTDLDGEGNLKPTVTFDRYYATLAETWLGIPSAQIFGTDVSPIDNLAFA